MDKAKLVEDLVSQLKTEYTRALAAVQDAADGATGEDAKAESKYDTRGLELSYLAAGQVERADQCAKDLASVEGFEFPSFKSTDAIDMGALVEAKLNHQTVYYLLAPAGGGIIIELDGTNVTVIGSASPLTGHLLEQKAGDQIEHPPLEVLDLS